LYQVLACGGTKNFTALLPWHIDTDCDAPGLLVKDLSGFTKQWMHAFCTLSEEVIMNNHRKMTGKGSVSWATVKAIIAQGQNWLTYEKV